MKIIAAFSLVGLFVVVDVSVQAELMMEGGGGGGLRGNNITTGTTSSGNITSPLLDTTTATQEAESLVFVQPQEPGVVIFNTRGIPYPDYRYRTWDKLDAKAQADATLLGYTSGTWNVPGTAEIEKKSYETIEFEALTTAVTRQQFAQVAEDPNKEESTTTIPPATRTKFEALFDMGFTDWEVYDCYVNHYGEYDWSDMELVVQQAYQQLGWNITSWNEYIPPPPSENKDWFQLTPQEQKAAAEICCLPETWQMLSLEVWTVDYSAMPTDLTTQDLFMEDDMDEIEVDQAELEPYFLTDNINQIANKDLYMPKLRFFVWDSLPQSVIDLITSLHLGYTQETWANITQAPIEKMRYKTLTNHQQAAVDALGFGPQDIYDCWIHHYESYTWGELETAKVSVYWEALGWSARSWEGLIAPPPEMKMSFADLSEVQQHSLNQLCFTQEMWDLDGFLVVPEPNVIIAVATPPPTSPEVVDEAVATTTSTTTTEEEEEEESSSIATGVTSVADDSNLNSQPAAVGGAGEAASTQDDEEKEQGGVAASDLDSSATAASGQQSDDGDSSQGEVPAPQDAASGASSRASSLVPFGVLWFVLALISIVRMLEADT